MGRLSTWHKYFRGFNYCVDTFLPLAQITQRFTLKYWPAISVLQELVFFREYCKQLRSFKLHVSFPEKDSGKRELITVMYSNIRSTSKKYTLQEYAHAWFLTYFYCSANRWLVCSIRAIRNSIACQIRWNTRATRAVEFPRLAAFTYRKQRYHYCKCYCMS